MAADQPTVLVVEDELAQREVLAYNLEADGFRVIKAENGEEALLLVDEDMPDIIVLDWMMPNLTGIEVCRRLKSRTETRGIPIIMLSARSEEVDKVRGLETGADDYVVKPYSVIELMARVRSMLRRRNVEPEENERYEREGLVVDLEHRRITRDGDEVKLTPKEFDILTLLVRYAGRVVTHEFLLREIWGAAFTGETHYLRVYIGQLRQKLEEDAAQPRFIQTEPGVGYRLQEEE